MLAGLFLMRRYDAPAYQILSRHRFKRPAIRLWLPLFMISLIILCGWLAAPRIRLTEFVALLFMIYVAISSLVTVSELSVITGGLLINRLLLPERYVPWSAIDRVIVFSQGGEGISARLEVASIGIYEGLSPLNRLAGPVYRQGLRQTIIISPDTIEDYDTLIAALTRNCNVFVHAAGQ